MREIDYKAPQTLREAIRILASANGAVKCLAGGTDVIDQLRTERRTASIVMDVKKIPDLMVLKYSPRTGLRLGAAVPCAAIYENPDVKKNYPIIVQSCQLIGSVQIQNRACVGGNLCNAAPSADTIPAFICLGATAIIAGPKAGPKGKRSVPVEEFCTGPGTTVLAPDELLVELRVPPAPANSAGQYLRFIPREEMDIAVAGVGSFVITDGRKEMVKDARIALAAVAPTPVRAKEAEEFLKGKPLTEENIRQAGELAPRSAKPISDVRGSAAYRLELIKVLTRRTLTSCRNQLQGVAAGAH